MFEMDLHRLQRTFCTDRCWDCSTGTRFKDCGNERGSWEFLVSIPVWGTYDRDFRRGCLRCIQREEFSALVSIGMVICLIGAVNIVNVRHMITRRIEDLFESDDMNTFFQLSQEQHNLECCGTRNGYQDWSSQVPESCICPESYWGTPKCQRVAVSPKKSGYWHKEMYTEVYSEPCLPFFMRFLNTMMDATVGILFGLAIVALIGVTMAIIMTCKIKKQMTAMPVPTYECSKPPAYEELYTMKSMPEHV
ncbi:tetraspanin-8-like isoform X2 [Alosa alosa]|uniref:tetraspanin-8-like isoform X2 n=1 Tax=Alosa alosa TaxID=278164 RepID=UPI0020153D6C|nr:tetraspanin-8-like isoform X2 [Alosa alosa]